VTYLLAFSPPLLAEASVVLLVSIIKPLLFMSTVVGWAWCVAKEHHDARERRDRRYIWWTAGWLASGIIGFALMIFIPLFLIGFVLGVLIAFGPAGVYVWYRNQQVSPDRKWNLTVNVESLGEQMEARAQQAATARASVRILNASGLPRDVPTGESPAGRAHALLEHWVQFAVPRDAQRIDMAIAADATRVKGVVDGVAYDQPPLAPPDAMALTEYLKDAAGLDVTDRRKPQRGQVAIDVEEMGKHSLTVETRGSTRGMTLTVHFDPSGGEVTPFDKLGLLPSQLQALTPVLDDRGRAVIVTCPPGHGLTGTLHSLVSRHDPYTESIVAVEPRTERELEGVDHQAYGVDASGEKVGETLRRVLQREPDVVMLDTVTDSKVAELIPEHTSDIRFYFGLLMPDTFVALRSWIKAIGDAEEAAESLGAIVAQRLIRKVCERCRIAVQPDADLLKKFNLSPDRVQRLYKHSGKVMENNKPVLCPVCNGLGYRGRIPAFEVLAVDDTARRLVAEEKLDELRSHARKQKMVWLQEAALTRIVEGVTTISEVTRVMQEGKAKGETRRQAAGDAASAATRVE